MGLGGGFWAVEWRKELEIQADESTVDLQGGLKWGEWQESEGQPGSCSDISPYLSLD